jgi:F-type H+-transporting ATPase subunit epsilon
MAETFEIEIATPERSLVREQALRAQIPGKQGYLGILPDHAPLIGELGIGVLTFASPGGGKYSLAVHGGYVEVLDNHVRVLADVAEYGSEIDVPRAERALKAREPELINVSEGADPAAALAAVLRAQARIEAAQKTARAEE